MLGRRFARKVEENMLISKGKDDMNGKFEHTIEISDEVFKNEIYPTFLDPKDKTSLTGKIVIALLLIVPFFWKYTISLGIANWIVFLSVKIIPKMVGKYLKSKKAINLLKKNDYRKLFFMHNPLTVGFDEENLYMKTKGYLSCVAWSYCTKYEISDKWIGIVCSGVPIYYFNVESLRKENMYDYLIIKARNSIKVEA